ncbi:unnamed protein product [Spirodela intermedia]|uniref:FHA domain-containing protein n=1 Tax=Spirodela intermedia TaxID=51605 RepID=A0A7I8KA81_SPIIN|nr:unnamed protein product [Spirodela intermedia]
MGPAIHRKSPARRRSSSSDRSRSPIRKQSPPRRSSPSRRDRRSSPGRKPSVRNSHSQGTRSPARDKPPQHYNRSPRRERSRSPARGKIETARTIRKGSPTSQDSPPEEKLPYRTRSPKRGRSRSPVRERAPYSSRSPQRRRSRSPKTRRPPEHVRPPTRQVHSSLPTRDVSSRSPSPRTKRLRRAQGDREVGKSSHMEEGRDAAREDRRRNKERGEDRDIPNDRRSTRERSSDGPSRSQRHRSISPEEPGQRSKSTARDEVTRARGAEEHRDGDEDSVARMKAAEEALEEKQKQKPSFELSGKLAEETNRVRGITLLFTEPSDARKPDVRWRLYVFKGGEVLNEPLYVHRQSCYLFGRERRIADVPTDHPSCSKQHAVLQFRLVETEQDDGLLSKHVRPYVMDLGSTNGTFLNDERIEAQRYYELREKDVLKFGNSSREYVLLHENSVK